MQLKVDPAVNPDFCEKVTTSNYSISNDTHVKTTYTEPNSPKMSSAPVRKVAPCASPSSRTWLSYIDAPARPPFPEQNTDVRTFMWGQTWQKCFFVGGGTGACFVLAWPDMPKINLPPCAEIKVTKKPNLTLELPVSAEWVQCEEAKQAGEPRHSPHLTRRTRAQAVLEARLWLSTNQLLRKAMRRSSLMSAPTFGLTCVSKAED